MTGARWAFRSAAAGAIAWAVLVALQLAGRGVGLIETLFLLAPLVIVPLGLRLLAVLDDGMATPAGKISCCLQPFAAAAVAAGFFLQSGWGAAILTIPWMGLAAAVSIDGAVRLVGGGSFDRICHRIGRIYLGVGAAWLFLTRLGATPMGFGEPIVLLTALHFHYAGFATALFAGAVAGSMKGRRRLPLRIASGGVVAGPALLAAGFMTAPLLRMTLALVLGVSVMLLAGFVLAGLTPVRPRPARWLLGFSAVCMLAAAIMVFPYAVGEYLGREWLLIPRMTRTHGVVNAIGFILTGHVAWTLALSPAIEALSGPSTRR